jgi:signal transduction histidine kinase
MFSSAIFLLITCALAAVWTFNRAYSGEKWVRHAYRVQVLVGDIESGLGDTGRAREGYLQTGDEQYLRNIEKTRTELFGQTTRLKALVADNIDQAHASEELEQAVRGRFHTLDQSMELAKAEGTTHETQDAYTAELVKWSQKASSIAEAMQSAESRLLERRQAVANSRFMWIIAIFAGTFALSLYTLWEHYRELNRELAERKVAERNARDLSAQIMNAQDQERRKIARDLHDGLGQNLAAAKMIADAFVNRPPEKQSVLELSAILEDAVSSTRSISHLLHPPLVDEIGFVPAARSYLEGFSRRSGVKVSCDLPADENRLPLDLEMTLFRVLQEALANIQRHSKSAEAEVKFIANKETATLSVRDHGIGMPPETMQRFSENGTHVGVGLAGMKERIRERDGTFEIFSDRNGTFISATLPLVRSPSKTA